MRGQTSHKLEAQIKRRARHEPLAYIRGFTEFYGRKFKIDKRVLEPRPESETMIDLLKKTVRDQTSHIVDVGTGSGALAITAKLELPSSKGSAVDIDSSCLAVAKKNADAYKVNIKFYRGNLLDPLVTSSLANSQTILLANLPYVPDSFAINQAASHEPKIAIYGGEDGFDLYRRLFEQIEAKNLKVSHVFTESMPPQHKKLAEIATKYGFRLQETEDFIQLFVPI